MNIFTKKFTLLNNIVSIDITDINTKNISQFYELNPFPHFRKIENKASLINQGDKNVIAKQFKNYVGFNKNILEVGSGTSQLSLYISIGTNNRVYALDATINSLRLACDFSNKNNIKNINFVHADIFDDIFKPASFDAIWCSGVLHHTKNPKLAFDILSKYLKKDGVIVLGLYNKYGRIITNVRQFLYKLFGKNIIMKIDPVLRKLDAKSFKIREHDKIDSWINDQYKHPIESKHTIDEVMHWFKNNNIDFINSIPSCKMIDAEQNLNLFDKIKSDSFLERFYQQIMMNFNSLGQEGGLFICIGKKIND